MVALVLMIVFGAVGLGIIGIMWSGYVLSIVWGWFIVPIFHLPPLTVAQAISVSLVFGLFRSHTSCAKDKDEPSWAPLLTAFLAPLLVLAFGAILRHWL